MLLNESNVPKLAAFFKAKFGKYLIIIYMTHFHCAFDSFPVAISKIHSRKLIALGKKSYLNLQVDEKDNEGYHVCCKGIPKQCIKNKCKLINITVKELYELL